MTTRRSLISLAIAIACCLVLPTESWAQKKGGGSTTPPPPSLPKFRYVVHFLDLPTQESLFSNPRVNIHGDAVGSYVDTFGYRRGYFSTAGITVDLNQIGVVGIPEGFAITSAIDINDFGYIVARLEPEDILFEPSGTPEIARGAVLDMNSSPPVLHPLPDEELGIKTWATRINNQGDVMGAFVQEDGQTRYYLFNPGLSGPADETFELLPIGFSNGDITNATPSAPATAIGTLSVDGVQIPCRYPRGGSLQIVDVVNGVPIQGYYSGGNDLGIMTTYWQEFIGKVKGIAQYKNYYARFSTSAIEYLGDGSYKGSTNALNNSGDLATSDNRTGQYIYRDGDGFVNVSDLLVGSASDKELWNAATGRRIHSMSDRADIPGTTSKAAFIGGTCIYSDGVMRPFVLVPVAVP